MLVLCQRLIKIHGPETIGCTVTRAARRHARHIGAAPGPARLLARRQEEAGGDRSRPGAR